MANFRCSSPVQYNCHIKKYFDAYSLNYREKKFEDHGLEKNSTSSYALDVLYESILTAFFELCGSFVYLCSLKTSLLSASYRIYSKSYSFRLDL